MKVSIYNHIKNKITTTEEMRKLLNEMSFQNISSPKLDPLDFRDHHNTVSYNNPISIYFSKHGFDEDYLQEGLIHTYPIDKTIQYVTDYFQLDSKNIKKQVAANGKEHILISIPNVGINLNIMKKAMDVCGYYPGTIAGKANINGVEWITVQYEAKFQNDDSSIIRKTENHLYHITPQYNEEKIIKNGFSPRCKNDLFNYPDRLYFVKGTIDENNIIYLGQQLCANNSSAGNNGLYTIFDIKLSEIPQTVSMYLDPNYPHGIFINDNLRPNCIIRTGHIDFSEQNPSIKWE